MTDLMPKSKCDKPNKLRVICHAPPPHQLIKMGQPVAGSWSEARDCFLVPGPTSSPLKNRG